MMKLYIILLVIIWAESLGDGWISTAQRPERESYRYQLEMILKGD